MRRIIKISLPLCLATILERLASYVDMWMVSSCGSDAMAAIGSTMTINWTIHVLFTVVGQGVICISAREFGKKNSVALSQICKLCSKLTLMLGVPVTVLILFISPAIPKLMQVPKDISHQSYLYFVSSFIPSVPLLAGYLFTSMLDAVERTRVTLVLNIWYNIVNLVMDSLLVLVLDMGAFGAGIATGIATVAWGIASVLTVLSSEEFKFKRDTSTYSWHELLKFVLPMLGVPFLVYPCYTVNGAITNSMGEIIIASHLLTENVQELFYEFIDGIAVGITTLLGECIGVGDYQQAKVLKRKCLVLSFLVLAVSATLLLFLRGPILKLFHADAMCSTLLIFAAIDVVLYGLQHVYSGMYRAVGKAHIDVGCRVVKEWVIKLIPYWIMVRIFGWDVTAYWILCVVGSTFSLMVFVILDVKGRMNLK